MSEAQTMIDEINAAQLDSPHWIEDEFPQLGEPVVKELNPDEHRWYIVSTMVFEFAGAYIGVCGPTSLKSESMSYCDVGMPCQAFEMEQVQAVTYRKKTQ